jgi:putative transposase
MAERGITVVHTTVLLWVQCFVPAFEKLWKRYARPVGSSWRVDETYFKVTGQWLYLYRAVDKQDKTVDFLLSKNRDKAAAVRFFKKVTLSGIEWANKSKKGQFDTPEITGLGAMILQVWEAALAA